MTGFTYNGVHCSAFGLGYIPDRTEQWFPDPEYEINDKDVEWKDGGYYYGANAKVRVFTLKCYFEEIDIATRQKIKQWVRRDSVGKLVFDDKPFVYWIVRPAKIPVGNWYLDSNESHSGTVTITFNAYEPFGYMTRKSNTAQDDDDAGDYCNIIDQIEMPDEPQAGDTSFDIYNPGTESCGLTIEISGSTDNPFRFYNETNGSKCEFGDLPTSTMRVKIDGDTGYVSAYLAGSESTESGFAYHDKGVVKLTPNSMTDCGYHYSGTSGTLHMFELIGEMVTSRMIGAKIYIDSVVGAFTVTSVSTANNRVYCTATGLPTVPETGTCTVQTLNHIVIQEKRDGAWTTPSTLTLTYIKTDYFPRVL